MNGPLTLRLRGDMTVQSSKFGHFTVFENRRSGDYKYLSSYWSVFILFWTQHAKYIALLRSRKPDQTEHCEEHTVTSTTVAVFENRRSGDYNYLSSYSLSRGEIHTQYRQNMYR